MRGASVTAAPFQSDAGGLQRVIPDTGTIAPVNIPRLPDHRYLLRARSGLGGLVHGYGAT